MLGPACVDHGDAGGGGGGGGGGGTFCWALHIHVSPLCDFFFFFFLSPLVRSYVLTGTSQGFRDTFGSTCHGAVS